MYRSLFFKHVAQTSPDPHIFEPTRSQGIYLYDQNDGPYVDLISGIGVSNLGHSHPAILQAIHAQADRYLHTTVYGEHIQSPQVQLAQLLADQLPPPLDNVYFASSGSEVVEGAMKLAKKYTSRSRFMAFNDAYHGSTHAPLSLMDNTYFSAAYRPLLPNIHFIKLNDLSGLKRIDEHTAGVFLETIQGEAGIQIPTKEFMQALRDRCNQTGSLLILDEIQAGMGRTGKLWAFEHFEIIPDVLLLSKAFGGGLPLAAFVTSQSIMKSISQNPILGHINTFGGNPLCSAAGLAALRVLTTTDLVKDVAGKSLLFAEKLQHPRIKQLRQLGFMMALDLGSADLVQKLIKYGFEHKLLFDWFLYNDQSVRLAPPLTITSHEIEEVCDVLIAGLDSI